MDRQCLTGLCPDPVISIFILLLLFTYTIMGGNDWGGDGREGRGIEEERGREGDRM